MWSVHNNLTSYNIKNIYTKFDSMYDNNYYKEIRLIFNYEVQIKVHFIKYILHIICTSTYT